MKKKLFLVFSLLLMLSIGVNAQNTSDLIKQIMNSADVNKEQAEGGTGALFEMAKENMSLDDFSKVSEAVPNMSGLLNAVPDLGGKKMGMLGSATTQLAGSSKVLAVFDKLGISQDKVALFTPVIANYVDEKGGKALGKILGDALKF